MPLKLIESDTDGIHVQWDPQFNKEEFLVDLNKLIVNEVSNWGMATDMKMDGTDYASAYFYKQKNYVLKDLDGNLKWTGVAFKSSSKPKMYDQVRDELGNFKLRDASTSEIRPYLKKVMHIENWALNTLTMRRNITKQLSEYQKNDLGRRLAMMAQQLHDQEPIPHTQYEYVFSKEGYQYKAHEFPKLKKLGVKINVDSKKVFTSERYMLASVAEHKFLDYRRYRDMIADLAGYFGYGNLADTYRRDPGITPITGWM